MMKNITYTMKNFEKAHGLEAITRLMRICQEIVSDVADIDTLRLQAEAHLEFCQKLQNELIDAGHINPVKFDCQDKDDPLSFFEQKLQIIQLREVFSTPAAKESFRKLREHADKVGA
jgi:hypothetical protein